MRHLILVATLALCCHLSQANAQGWIRAYGGPNFEFAYNVVLYYGGRNVSVSMVIVR